MTNSICRGGKLIMTQSRQVSDNLPSYLCQHVQDNKPDRFPLRIASAYKIGLHLASLQAYLRDGWTIPVTLELDLTTACNRACPHCATIKRPPSMELSWDLADRLLQTLGGKTKGLLLAGGEPTISPIFIRVVSEGHASGFEQIAVVTNGSTLQEPHITSAMVEHVSAIRISIGHSTASAYAQAFGCDEKEFKHALQGIERLRCATDANNSSLQIGVSALTCSTNVSRLSNMAEQARSAGAHWVYFHPLCLGWCTDTPYTADQTGVFEELQHLSSERLDDFQVYFFEERYKDTCLSIAFDFCHAAHFLLVVGADGCNYLTPDTKYMMDYMVHNFEYDWRTHFTSYGPRLDRIRSITDKSLLNIRTRNRGALYSTLIQQIVSGKAHPTKLNHRASQLGIGWEHIL